MRKGGEDYTMKALTVGKEAYWLLAGLGYATTTLIRLDGVLEDTGS
jgi:hypothetical protein